MNFLRGTILDFFAIFRAWLEITNLGVNTLGGGAHVVNPFTDTQFDKRVKNVLSMSWLLV
jgi:hypothetical protein